MTGPSTDGREKHPPASRAWFDSLYGRYHRRERVHPDPLEVLYDYPDGKDREIAALVAASLAFGRVGQILAAVREVLGKMGSRPRDFLERAEPADLKAAFGDFRYRFVSGETLVRFLDAVRGVLREYGSLNACFLDGYRERGETVAGSLDLFVEKLTAGGGGGTGFLLPLPGRKSACKRLNLFLRWMVRRDEIDPGGWEGVSPEKLIVPVDVHMHRLCRRLRITGRKDASMATAVEITRFFRSLEPGDPVRYDFALTRLGMGPGEERAVWFSEDSGTSDRRSGNG
ncbi:MAG TPA: TIGR02757 family protein [Syntrophales bacterium]|nr:TIGR02757 family protein [Syntrophales bacterium]HQB29415.1 TIGR02757 family protein [Syntrophales bacterium]HQN78928.1 TIGR02757 family protein [Syntrophales bacterium]HQQ28090.1 TIGR02757 family protein [Syntrophales bacterium]